jgi:hypothetical protein
MKSTKKIKQPKEVDLIALYLLPENIRKVSNFLHKNKIAFVAKTYEVHNKTKS